jgi:hypothetical protein
MGQDKPTQLGPLERASLNHSLLTSCATNYFINPPKFGHMTENIEHRIHDFIDGFVKSLIHIVNDFGTK